MDIFGPDKLWAGSVSDADIMKAIMKETSFENFFLPKDVIISDRGFERIKPELESKEFVVSIPCLQRDNRQLTTEDASKSRICTRQRWVLEAVNSSLKRFKHLKNVVTAEAIPHIYTDLRIAVSMHNAFFARYYSDGDDK